MNIVQPENMILYVTFKMGKRTVKEFADELGCSRACPLPRAQG